MIVVPEGTSISPSASFSHFFKMTSLSFVSKVNTLVIHKLLHFVCQPIYIFQHIDNGLIVTLGILAIIKADYASHQNLFSSS